MGWNRYVALGDSFTEGIDDPYPDGTFRGWADLVARRLQVQYANLAIRGRLLDTVIAEQVRPALEMRPDLISFAAGGNDLLRRHCDTPALMVRFDKLIEQLTGTGAEVILFRFTDVHFPGYRVIEPRVRYLNDSVVETAHRHGARLVDLWSDDEFRNRALWSYDRLHLAPAGHRRTAAHVLKALGVEPDPEWWQTPPWQVVKPRPAAWAEDIVWATRHLAPWVKRRLTGRSSGDGITAKRPSLGQIGVEA